MEELWTRLKELQEKREGLVYELGEKRYALDRQGKEVMGLIEKLDVVSNGMQEVIESLEVKFGIPEGGKYTLDMEKQELRYEPDPAGLFEDEVLEETVKETAKEDEEKEEGEKEEEEEKKE